jgi:cytochrome c553
MPVIVRNLSDKDIVAVSTYYAGMPLKAIQNAAGKPPKKGQP